MEVIVVVDKVVSFRHQLLVPSIESHPERHWVGNQAVLNSSLKSLLIKIKKLNLMTP